MKLGAVIVTYNRINKLKKALQAFDSLVFYPEKVYIVDNHSNDGTPEYLIEWEKDVRFFDKEVITLSRNIGGSGGFYTGLKRALDDSCDWVWVSDDDAYPQQDVFRLAKKYIDCYNNLKISAICGTVSNQIGIEFYHRRNIFSKGLCIHDVPSAEADYQKNYFDINTFSYVGTVINASALMEVGLTLKDYFIWCDDTEHGLRLSEVGIIRCIPEIKVYHDVDIESGQDITWKTYYGVRNQLDMYKRHFSHQAYVFRVLREKMVVLKKILNGQREGARLFRCAIQDCQNNRLGIHPIYKPGWKPEGK